MKCLSLSKACRRAPGSSSSFPLLPTGATFSPGPFPAGFESGVARFQDLRFRRNGYTGARGSCSEAASASGKEKRQTGVGPRTIAS